MDEKSRIERRRLTGTRGSEQRRAFTSFPSSSSSSEDESPNACFSALLREAASFSIDFSGVARLRASESIYTGLAVLRLVGKGGLRLSGEPRTLQRARKLPRGRSPSVGPCLCLLPETRQIPRARSRARVWPPVPAWFPPWAVALPPASHLLLLS